MKKNDLSYQKSENCVKYDCNKNLHMNAIQVLFYLNFNSRGQTSTLTH